MEDKYCTLETCPDLGSFVKGSNKEISQHKVRKEMGTGGKTRKEKVWRERGRANNEVKEGNRGVTSQR